MDVWFRSWNLWTFGKIIRGKTMASTEKHYIVKYILRVYPDFGGSPYTEEYVVKLARRRCVFDDTYWRADGTVR